MLLWLFWITKPSFMDPILCSQLMLHLSKNPFRCRVCLINKSYDLYIVEFMVHVMVWFGVQIGHICKRPRADTFVLMLDSIINYYLFSNLKKTCSWGFRVSLGSRDLLWVSWCFSFFGVSFFFFFFLFGFFWHSLIYFLCFWVVPLCAFWYALHYLYIYRYNKKCSC